MTQLWGGGYYQEFGYMPDEYSRKHDIELADRQASIEKREKICSHDWRNSSQELRLKHDSMMVDPRNKETYPYLGGDKDTELVVSKGWLRKDAGSSRSGPWSQERGQGSAEASFMAGKGRGLEDDGKTSRMSLPTIVTR